MLRVSRCLGCVLLLCGSLSCVRAEMPVATEYKLKASFLYNFAVLTEWPSGAFASDNAPLTIGVIGTDPFRSILDEVVADKTVGGRKIAVARYKRAEEIQHCQILFISASEESRLASLLHSLEHRPVLTVSEMNSFNREGGMIWIGKRNDEIKFRIRRSAAKEAGLKLSSRLLALSLTAKPRPSDQEENE